MAITSIECDHFDCRKNYSGECGCLRKTVKIHGEKHTITKEWTKRCPFYLNEQMYKKDCEKLWERMGIK